MAIVFGTNCKAYYDTSTRNSWGTFDSTNGIYGGTGSGTLVEMAGVKDVTLKIDAAEADVTTRGNGGWKASAAVLKEASIELEMPYNPADASYLAMQKSFLVGATIPVAILDGARTTNGSQGLWADCAVMNIERGEPVGDITTCKITLKPGSSTTAPQYVKVVGAV